MQNKLQELTDKIYTEGIERGKKEAETIISEARAESEKIKKEAEKEAEAIIAQAGKEAEEMKKNALSELRISFRHALNSLKQDIERLIARRVIDDPVSQVFSDNSFVAKLIEIVAEKWSAGSNEGEIKIFLAEEMMDEIKKYLNIKTSRVLSSGIIFHPVKSMDKGFELSPQGKDYKISVTDTDFASYIKEFLRPKLIDLLFEKNK